MYHGREGSISYNIIRNLNQILAEGICFIILKYLEYDPEQFIDVGTKHIYSIEMIKHCGFHYMIKNVYFWKK